MADTIEVHGLNELLRELRKYEPEMYKMIRKELLDGAQPLSSAVGSDFPDKPLKYWHSSGDRRGNAKMPPYIAGKARRGIKATVVRGGRSKGVLRLEQRDAGGQVYDAAGSKSMSRFVKNLDKHAPTKSKPPKSRSRLMYSSVAANMGLVEDNILKAIGKTDKMIQTRILQK
jgi:hypothetical protein